MKTKFRVVLSIAAFDTTGVFVRNVLPASGGLALYRTVIAVAAFLLRRAYTGQSIKTLGIKKELPLLFFLGVVINVDWILLFEAYRYTAVAVATLSYYFAPVTVTVSSTLLLRERLISRQAFCFVMSAFGLVLMTGASSEGGSNDLLGTLLGLGAALFYAATALLNEEVRNVLSLNWTFLQFIAAILVMMPYMLLTGGSRLDSLDLTDTMNLLAVRIFHTDVCYRIYFSSLWYLKGQETFVLSYINPLVAVVVSVLLLRERVSSLQAAGGYMILGFTVLNEWNPGTREHYG